MSFIESRNIYHRYNDVIASTIFDGRFASAPLYLDIEGEIASDIATKLNSTVEEFKSGLSAAVIGSLVFQERDPLSWHREMRERWEVKGRSAWPPFIALLTAASIAAEKMVHDDQFEAHNYYQRLFKYLRLFDESAQHKLKTHFGETVRCWQALNTWLFDKQYELGRPTAQQINGFRYVSYAISQALIRDAERQNLHLMFADAFLSPGERLTAREMQIYLDKWISSRHATNWLTRMWTKPDLKQRVTEAACEELLAWSGADAPKSASGNQSFTLTWACAVSGFPPKLNLYLTLPPAPAKAVGQINPSTCKSSRGRRLLPTCEGHLSFEPLGDTGFSSLEPRNNVSAGELLQENFELQNADGTVSLRKLPRSIIPLVKLDTGGLYKEVSRLSLLQPHFILCHKLYQIRLRDFLAQAARPRHKEYTSKQLKGLPEDWFAFGPVSIVRCVKDQPNDIQAILPHEQPTIELGRGVRLFDDTWHSDAAPEALAAAEEGPLRMSYVQQQPPSPQILRTPDSGTEAFARIDLKSYSPQPGTLGHISVYRGGTPLVQQRICFGSADTPRKIEILNVSELGYRLDPGSPAGLFSAEVIPDNRNGALHVSGMLVSGNRPVGDDAPHTIAIDSGEVASFDEEAEIEDAGFLTAAPVIPAESCVIRHHCWRCQPFNEGDNRNAPMWMECPDCGQKFLTKNRGKRPAAVPIQQRIILPPPSITPGDEWRPSPDTVFDALCYVGGSRWPRLAEICSASSDDPYIVSSMASRLSALGHIDICTEGIGGPPLLWRSAPPAAVMREDGSAFLAGFRSNKYLEGVRTVVEQLGGVMERILQQSAPQACILTGLGAEGVELVCGEIRDAHGRALKFTASPSATIAERAPALNEVWSALQDAYIRAGDGAEKYNPYANRWESVTNTDGPGAYRSMGASRLYAVRRQDGALKRAPFRLAKILGARQAGVRISGYRPASRDFVVALGCEPPPVLERALVACSGLLPYREGGRLIYNNVDALTAGVILEKLNG